MIPLTLHAPPFGEYTSSTHLTTTDVIRLEFAAHLPLLCLFFYALEWILLFSSLCLTPLHSTWIMLHPQQDHHRHQRPLSDGRDAPLKPETKPSAKLFCPSRRHQRASHSSRPSRHRHHRPPTGTHRTTHRQTHCRTHRLILVNAVHATPQVALRNTNHFRANTSPHFRRIRRRMFPEHTLALHQSHLRQSIPLTTYFVFVQPSS